MAEEETIRHQSRRAFIQRTGAVGLGLAAQGAMFGAPAKPTAGGTRLTRLHSPEPGHNAYYLSNRAPLRPSALMKLPLGTVQPHGWLHEQLHRMANGFSGHLPEVSHWAVFDGSAWASPTGEGRDGFEEVPYWLRGYGNLGYLLHDARITADYTRWINAILASQRPDGYFGPESNRANHDLWPNMLVLYALRSFYEATHDTRIIPFMTKYFRWQQTLSPNDFLPGSWAKVRGGDNLDSIYWLYNQTGESWLLDLASFNHQKTVDWTDGVASLHGVDLAQSFREPATYYQQTHDPKYLAATLHDYHTYWGTYGQVPGGMYGADENARPGYTSPRQAAETCAMVEAMFSAEILIGITGDTTWADRCEDVAFNSLPASMTAQLNGLHYLTAPNMIQLDHANKAPMIQDSGVMFSYDAAEPNYRCCQHNVTMGWPYFAEHLWMATPGNGLAAALYAPCAVRAKVGDGTEVTLTETTDYPFDETVMFHLRAARPVRFPLLLRVPGWCTAPQVHVNGKPISIPAGADGWLQLERLWASGDQVRLTLPMSTADRTWTENDNAVSVSHGPLTYALKIGERTVRYGGTDRWPAVDVYPTTPWNYGLVLNSDHPATSFQVVRKAGPLAPQPFTPETTPIALKARGKRIPEWRQEDNGMVGKLQQSPALSEQPTESITLIPMGAARLRIASFPQIGSGLEAHRWVKPDTSTKFAYSYLNPSDGPLSLSDTFVPASSTDTDIPRFTWWDHKGTLEWVEYRFDKPRHIHACQVYWFDDAPIGGLCRIPTSWSLLWWNGKTWKTVQNPSEYGVEKDRFNSIAFTPVETTRLRLTAQLQPGYSGGLLAWRIS